MSVFVDKLFSTARTQRWPYSMACHLFSDDRCEIHDIAYRLGLQARWFENHPHHPHYNLTPNKRKQAICLGAIELTDEQTKNFWNFGSPNFEIRNGD